MKPVPELQWLRVLSAEIALTNRCNENCRHCLVVRKTARSLPLPVVRSLLRQLRRLGAREVHITGGEPLMYRALFDVLKTAKSLGLRVKLITNGSLIDRAVCRRLRQLRVDEVQVSLYAADAPVHDYTTRCPGSFDATVRGLDLLKAYGLNVTVATVVMRHTFAQVPELRSLARSRGWKILFDYMLRPKDNGSTAPLRYRLTGSQIRQMISQGWLFGSRLKRLPRVSEIDSCLHQLARTHLFVDPGGSVFPGITFRKKAGTILRQPLAQIWFHSPALKRLRALQPDDFSCGSCAYRRSCHWDPGLALIEHGNMFVKPREYCRFMRGLRAVFNPPVN